MKLFKILVLCLALIPINVSASEVVYKTKNLEETFKDEEIEYDLSNYQETDKQITIYMFRGKGCSVCKKFLNFLNSISEEYGKYFKLESYEVWYNKDNNKLMKKVADFLEEDAGGVPFIVIGDQVFPGYAEQFDDAIKQAIVDLYNSSNRYDVFEQMAKAEAEANKTQNIDVKPIIIWNGIFIILATGAIILYDYNKSKKLDNLLSNIEKNLKENNKNVLEEKSKAKTTKNTKNTKKSDKK